MLAPKNWISGSCFDNGVIVKQEYSVLQGYYECRHGVKYKQERNDYYTTESVESTGEFVGWGCGADLVWAEQRPAELPGLTGGLGLSQPLLGHILMLHVRVIVQLLEGLEEGGEDISNSINLIYNRERN